MSFATFKVPSWGAAIALLYCLPAWAVPPAAPLLTKVGQTVSSTTEKAFVWQWDDNSSDEDLFEMRLRVGKTGAFSPVNYVLNNAQFGTWYTSNRFLANVPEGSVLQLQVLAVHATIVRDQVTNQIKDFTVTERSVPSNTMTLTYHASPLDGTLYPPGGSPGLPGAVALSAVLVTDNATPPVVLSDGKIKLAWSDNSTVEDGVEFFVKKSDAATYPSAAGFSLPFNITEFLLPAYAVQRGTDVFGLVPGVAYTMRMRAVQGGINYSGWSNEVSVTMPALRSPTNLIITQVDETTLDLRWTDNSDNEHGFVIAIELGAPFGDYQWDSVAANVTSYRVRNLRPGSKVKWKITGAFNPGGGADLIASVSPTVAVTTPPTLPSNTVEFAMTMGGARNLAAVVTDDAAAGVTYAALSWEEFSTAETAIEILQRRAGTTDEFTSAKVLPANTTSTVLGMVLLPGNIELVARTASVDADGTVGAKYVAGDQANSNVVVVTTRDGFTSAARAFAQAGEPFSFTVATTNAAGAERLSAAVVGLPAGLAFNDATGVISGTPLVAGFYDVGLTAVFANGWTAHNTLRLRVNPALPAAPVVAVPAGTGVLAQTLGTGQPLSVGLGAAFADGETEKVVRMVTTRGSIDVVLWPSVAPLTVANFMAYVNAGDYAGVAFHRVAPTSESLSVLQGGGYKVYGTSTDTFEEVTRRPAVRNEPGLSNVKNTLAMAKGSDPNSATHDFFFNLKDNTSLDNNTGGFTVFGRVARAHFNGSGIDTTMQAIMDLPGKKYSVKLRDAASGAVTPGFNPLSGLGDLERWPLDTPVAPDAMDVTKLVKIVSMAELTSKFTYTIQTAPDPAVATASLVNGALSLTGVATGSTSMVVRATDVDGQSVAATFAVTVDGALIHPAITQPPVAATVGLGAAAALSVTATGSNLTYQWRRAGVAIAGETGSMLSITATTRADDASYDVVVANAATSVTSAAVRLTVNAVPLITAEPVAVTRNYGGNASFTVVATGTGPLAYAWFKGVDVIAGATGATLTLSPVVLSSVASYHAVVTNTFGSAVSADALLTVLRVDTDGDGLLDDEEVTLGTNRTLVDSDGDGYSDAVEVALGSSGALASSTPAAAYFVAERDGLATLSGVGMKRLVGGSYTLPGDSAATAVPDQWLAATELTNAQFASVLQYAVKVLNVAEVVSSGGRKLVRYPKTTGEVICYLADAVVSPPAGELLMDATGRSFYVAVADAQRPARAVSWYGGYLATLVLNARHGYAAKCVPATWGYDAALSGYTLPSQAAWGWAARGGVAALAYPTGKLLPTLALAKFGDSAPTARPVAVGGYAASALGFYDLAGNVAEWMLEGDATNGATRGGGYNTGAPGLANALLSTVLAKASLEATTGVRVALKEEAAPVIVTGPVAKFVKAGQPILLSVTATGTPPLSYEWLKNDKVIAGQTGAALSIPAAVLTDGAAYKARVKIGTGAMTTSTAAAVAVAQVPTPVVVTKLAPNKATKFAVKVQGAPGQVFNYAWSRPLQALENDYRMHGVDKPTLEIISAQQGMSDTYNCAVSVANWPTGPTITAAYGLVVYDLPVITPATRLPYGVVTGAFSYEVPFDNASSDRGITRWSATGLPTGFAINPTTGEITGRGTVATTVNVRITATNPFGSTTESVALVIRGLSQGLVGNFVGTLARDAINAGLGGRLDLKTTSTGAVTGKVTLGTLTYPLTGNLVATVNTGTGVVGQTATASFNILRKGLPTLPLVVTLDAANDAMNATLTVPAVAAVVAVPAMNGHAAIPAVAAVPERSVLLAGWRAVEVISVRQGDHTLALAGPVTPAAALDVTLAPQGYSFASVKVAATGATTVAGQLADGTPFTCAGWVGPEQVLLYAPLYKGQGSVLGALRIAGDVVHTIRIGAGEHVTWSRADLGAASTERSYKRGFGPLEMSVVSGGRYRAPATGAALLGLLDTTTPPAMGPATLADNARLSFASGGLLPDFTQDLRVTPTSTAIFPTANNNTVTLPLTKAMAATGLLKGGFTLTTGGVPRVVTYFVMVVPDPADTAKGKGYGYFTLPGLAPDVKTSDVLSGRVEMGAAP